MKKKIDELIKKWASYRDQHVQETPYYKYFSEMVYDLEELRYSMEVALEMKDEN